MDTAKTGAYLASLRKNAGMTQQDAADRLGVSNKTVSKWESGGGFPDITVLPALAELYGVTADDILAGAAVRSSGGDSQVAQYLARRGELRWRIGFSAAALFLLAATMFYAYAWSWLLLAGGAASVWVGWGRCDGDVLRRRLVMLLPWAMLVLYFLLVRFQLPFRLAAALLADYANSGSVVSYLAVMLRWDMLLLLFPPVCGLLRAASVRWSGRRYLLSRPYSRVVAVLWLTSLGEEIVHWIVAVPPTLAYAATSYPSYFRTYQALQQDFSATLPFLYVPAITIGAALLALAFLLTGCGTPAPSPGKEAPSAAPAAEESYQAPPLALAEFDEAAAFGESGVLLDTSHTAQGYVAAAATSDARLKFRVSLGESKYNYDLPADGTPAVYPLQLGGGEYTFEVWRQNPNGKYARLYGRTETVALASEFEPFVRPSQLVNYGPDSACVKKAAELAGGAASDVEVVSRIYNYLKDAIRYDKEKAAVVESGYLPDPDETLAGGEGICFDYAALAAAMLRSQGIPTKEITGYVSPTGAYHAWNMVYLQNTGWVTVAIELAAGQWDRIDITFAAGGADSGLVGDGTAYTDRYTY